LKQPSVALVLCGYSFRDDHINEVIFQGLQGTQTAIAFALLYDDIGKYPKAVKLASERSNLSLLARDGAVISGREAKWHDKDAESAAADNLVWVTWTPIDPQDDKSRQMARFSLGDFSDFGKFLHELVGRIHQSSEASNAE
jgi:hypothetical protein